MVWFWIAIGFVITFDLVLAIDVRPQRRFNTRSWLSDLPTIIYFGGTLIAHALRERALVVGAGPAFIIVAVAIVLIAWELATDTPANATLAAVLGCVSGVVCWPTG